MRIPVAVLALFLATSLSAQNVRFDPPNPTARTPITAHVIGYFSPCTATAVQNGMRLSIQLHNCTLPYSGPLVDLPVDLGVLPVGVYDVGVGFAPPAILIGLGSGTLVVQDAAPPFQLTPNVAVLGGMQVTLTGPNLISCTAGITPPICTDAIVKFGDSVATIISKQQGEIVVQAPQHDPGIIDVTVERPGSTLRSTAAFYYVPNDKIPDPAFFEPVLFPIAFSGPGAFGSLWQTEIDLRNENDYPLTLSSASIFTMCVFLPCNPDRRLPRHSTVRVNFLNIPNGYIELIPRQAEPAVHFGVLVKDMSRQAEALGAEIPVVREKDFFGRPLELLNVPTDLRFRVALRVYDRGLPAAIGLTIYSFNTDESLVSTFLFPGRQNPAYVQISDLIAT
ncbi:MAG TPA: IPT/TIG domain-containing protein, partial [Thermoanaerobaculia bacterium]